MKQTLLECVRPAGEILLRYFGRNPNARRKGDQSNIVTDADLASERRAWFEAVVELVKPRVKKTADFVGQLEPFLRGQVEYDPAAVGADVAGLACRLAARLRERLGVAARVVER